MELELCLEAEKLEKNICFYGEARECLFGGDEIALFMAND